MSMTLDELGDALKELNTNVLALTEALSSAGGAAAEPAKPAKATKATKAAPEPEPEGPSRDDVKAALKSYAALESKEEAIALLKKHGKADSLSELEDANFQAVIDACNE